MPVLLVIDCKTFTVKKFAGRKCIDIQTLVMGEAPRTEVEAILEEYRTAAE